MTHAIDANLNAADGIVKPEGESPATPLARTEAVQIEDGTLRRDESVRTKIHWAGLVVLWSVVAGGLVLAGIWMRHLATPERLHFLTVAQLNNIQTVLLSAVGSSFATQAGKRWLDPVKKSDPN